jgi:DnaJ-class molecular chaperone
VTKRRDIRREELVEEKNRREDKNAINITYRGLINKVNFMPRKFYERAEDWLVTCPVCHGTGATGEGDSRKRCPKCDGAGKVSSTSQTRK